MVFVRGGRSEIIPGLVEGVFGLLESGCKL